MMDLGTLCGIRLNLARSGVHRGVAIVLAFRSTRAGLSAATRLTPSPNGRSSAACNTPGEQRCPPVLEAMLQSVPADSRRKAGTEPGCASAWAKATLPADPAEGIRTLYTAHFNTHLNYYRPELAGSVSDSDCPVRDEF
jgi:hypothetical protein